MPPANRHDPTRTPCSDSQFSLMEFMREYPDDAACLEHLWRERFSTDGEHADCPKCDREGVVFKRYATTQGRQSWTCTACGHHVHPTAGTIFHKSSTSLHLWFYAMYLMASTRCGISAKQLERELGVSYRTAWRMLNLIRNELMGEDQTELSGEVEVDETFYGGRPRAAVRRAGKSWERRAQKPIIVGMVERGGRVRTTIIRERSEDTLKGIVREYVLPASMIFTDEHASYDGLDREYRGHRRIHHLAKIYVDGSTHTQTIEGFFSLVKSGLRGTYHSVSRKWLQSYVNEYSWRYNRRDDARAMFRSLVDRAAT
jgi:transposase